MSSYQINSFNFRSANWQLPLKMTFRFLSSIRTRGKPSILQSLSNWLFLSIPYTGILQPRLSRIPYPFFTVSPWRTKTIKVLISTRSLCLYLSCSACTSGISWMQTPHVLDHTSNTIYSLGRSVNLKLWVLSHNSYDPRQIPGTCASWYNAHSPHWSCPSVTPSSHKRQQAPSSQIFR